jgi:hypothetical protein
MILQFCGTPVPRPHLATQHSKRATTTTVQDNMVPTLSFCNSMGREGEQILHESVDRETNQMLGDLCTGMVEDTDGHRSNLIKKPIRTWIRTE